MTTPIPDSIQGIDSLGKQTDFLALSQDFIEAVKTGNPVKISQTLAGLSVSVKNYADLLKGAGVGADSKVVTLP